MTTAPADKIVAFRALHHSGCFQMPNPWDAGSARYLQTLGFKALASTSAGFAWSTGRVDYGLKVDEVIDHLTRLNAVVDLPINADFEGGFAVEPQGVAHNVTRAVLEGGVAGLSIEDRAETSASLPLLDLQLSVERIKAARAAIEVTGSGVVLTARCEGLLVGMTDLSAIIDRLRAYAEAGADCLFAPGLKDDASVREVCAALAPLPVNVIAQSGWSAAHMASLGVRRISVGGRLAMAAYGASMQVAKAWLDGGTLDRAAEMAPPIAFGEAFS